MTKRSLMPSNPTKHEPLDDALADSFPASDPVAATSPTIAGEPLAPDRRSEAPRRRLAQSAGRGKS